MSTKEFLDWYRQHMAQFQAEGLGPDQDGKAMEIILVGADQFDDMLEQADRGNKHAQRCAKAFTAWSKQVELSGLDAGCLCCETVIKPPQSRLKLIIRQNDRRIKNVGMFAMFNPLDPAHKNAVCGAICWHCVNNKTQDQITRELMDMLGEHFGAEVQLMQ